MPPAKHLTAGARGAGRSLSRVVTSRAARASGSRSKTGVRPTAGEWLQVRALSGFRIHVAPELPGAEGRKVDFADAKRSYANKSSFELARSLMMCAVR